MKEIIVKTQKDFDKIKDDFCGVIRITGNLDRVNRHFNNAEIYIYGNAVIENAYDNAVIENVCGNAVIKNAYDNAVIKYAYDNAVIENVCGNAVIKNAYGNAVIKYAYDNAVIENVCGNAVILLMCGLASALLVYGFAKITAKGRNIVRHYKSETKIKLNLSKTVNHIVLPDIEMNNKEFEIQYPVERKADNLILYKAVHKIDGKYLSNYDRNIEYKIGETYKHEVEKSGESCGVGIHLAWKRWAVLFGKNWGDMALLECETAAKDIYVASDCDGKVRTSKMKVLREVPKSEYD